MRILYHNHNHNHNQFLVRWSAYIVTWNYATVQSYKLRGEFAGVYWRLYWIEAFKYTSELRWYSLWCKQRIAVNLTWIRGWWLTVLGLVHHHRPLKVSCLIIKVNTVRNRFTDDFHVWKVYLTKPIGRLWTKSRLRLGHSSLTKSINSSGPEPDAIVKF